MLELCDSSFQARLKSYIFQMCLVIIDSLLLLVIGIKILLTKGFMIGFLFLCVAIKGKSLHRNSVEWNDYSLNLREKEVLHFAISLYLLLSAAYFCHG